MNLMNLGREQIENGSLNDMLKQVGIDDVNSFVKQFRKQANQESTKVSEDSASSRNQQADFMSMGSSFLNQMTGGGTNKKQGSGSADIIGGAMNAYKMFSGNKTSSGESQGSNSSSGLFGSAMSAYKMFSGGKSNSNTSSGGNMFDNIGSTIENAQQMHQMLKQLDKNGDGKITVEDIQLILNGLGLGSVSPHVSKALFKAIDQNKNGQLDLTDVMALAAIVNKLNSRFGSAAKQPTE